MQTKKPTIKIALLLLLLISLSYLFEPSASQSTTVKIEAPTSIANHNPFTATISISNVQNLYGLEVIVKWNPTILQAANIDLRLGVESYPDGVLHEKTGTPSIFIAENNLTQSTGEFRLVATSMAPASAFSGSGNIVKITFNPLSNGNAVLDLESALSDYPPEERDPRISLPIQHTSQDTTITITQNNITPSVTVQPSNPPTQSTQPSTTPSNSPFETEKPQTTNIFGIEPLLLLGIVVILIVVVIALAIVIKKKSTKRTVL